MIVNLQDLVHCVRALTDAMEQDSARACQAVLLIALLVITLTAAMLSTLQSSDAPGCELGHLTSLRVTRSAANWQLAWPRVQA